MEILFPFPAYKLHTIQSEDVHKLRSSSNSAVRACRPSILSQTFSTWSGSHKRNLLSSIRKYSIPIVAGDKEIGPAHELGLTLGLQ